jgi:hypothetical protein
MPEKIDLLEKMLADNVALNRELLEMQRARIPKYLANARQYVAGGLQLNFAYHTQSQILLRVTCLLVTVGSPGNLQIGDRNIPVTGGMPPLYLGEEGMLIRPEDQIILTQTVPGAMGLEFFGEEMGDRGKRW